MHSRKLVSTISGILLAASVGSTALAMGDYVRKGKQGDEIITVTNKGGKLFCTRKKDGFEMCHGMAKEGDAWKGKKMKHPDMPGFMTFNGTVTFSGNGLKIKGCAVGNSMCDEEKWSKK